jgi:hypothetical protein
MSSLESSLSQLQQQQQQQSTHHQTAAVRPDFDLILRNIGDLNGLVSENQHEVVVLDGHGGQEKSARFEKRKAIAIEFYRDGFKLDNQVDHWRIHSNQIFNESKFFRASF